MKSDNYIRTRRRTLFSSLSIRLSGTWYRTRLDFRDTSSVKVFLSSTALILNKIVTMALGFVSWLVAARLFAPSELGLASGVVSAMMLCTQLAILGVGSAVIVMFPQHQKTPAQLLNTAISVVTGAAVLAAGIFLLLASSVFQELRVVGSVPSYTVLFLMMTLFGSLGILLDQISIAQRRGYQVLLRGLLTGVVTLLLIGTAPFVVGYRGSLVIFVAWTVGGLLACILGARQLRLGLSGYSYRLNPSKHIATQLLRIGFPNWILTMVERAPALVLPIVVTELLSPEMNAYWYAVWMMAWIALIVPIQIALTLFAEISHRPHELRRIVSHGVNSSLGIGIPMAATLVLFAPLALSIMGDKYADAGSTALRVLVISVVPLTLIQAYFAVCRATGRLREAGVTGALCGAVAVCSAALIGAKYGLTGMAVVWVATQSITGVWALWRLRAISARYDRPVVHNIVSGVA